jgi:hypothetical protein
LARDIEYQRANLISGLQGYLELLGLSLVQRGTVTSLHLPYPPILRILQIGNALDASAQFPVTRSATHFKRTGDAHKDLHHVHVHDEIKLPLQYNIDKEFA